MSIFFSILSFMIVFGMIFTVIYNAVKIEKYYAELFEETIIKQAVSVNERIGSY